MWTSSHRLPVRLEKVLPFQRHFLLRKAPKGIQQEEMPCESGKVYPMLKGSVNTMWIDKKSWFYQKSLAPFRGLSSSHPHCE